MSRASCLRRLDPTELRACSWCDERYTTGPSWWQLVALYRAAEDWWGPCSGLCPMCWEITTRAERRALRVLRGRRFERPVPAPMMVGRVAGALQGMRP